MFDHFINHLVRGHRPAYVTAQGAAFLADSRELLAALPDESLDLIITLS